MTESEWLESRRPIGMIQFLKELPVTESCVYSLVRVLAGPGTKFRRHAVGMQLRWHKGTLMVSPPPTNLLFTYRPARRVAEEVAKERPEDPFPYHLIASADTRVPRHLMQRTRASRCGMELREWFVAR